MHLKEFSELKEGDKVRNDMSQSTGTVTKAETMGVRVRWGDGRPGNDVTFFYHVNSTAWMHWSRADEIGQ